MNITKSNPINIKHDPPDVSYVVNGAKFNYRVCGIMIHDGKLLAMHDERSPYYYLPGGRVKMGETAEHAILREIEEELNITPRIVRPLWLNQGFFLKQRSQTFLRALHYKRSLNDHETQ